MARSEVLRQWVHVGAGVPALALVWLSWPQAAGVAAAAVLFNRYVLPTLVPRLRRESEHAHPWTSGLVLYPLSVLALVLVFRDRLDVVAGAWGVLAAGDGMATLVGRSVRSGPLPWNTDKSIAGLVAFVACAAPAALGLLLWTTEGSMSTHVVIVCCLAALVAGLSETLPIRMDDNITVPLAAALVLWSGSLTDPTTYEAAWPSLRDVFWLALAANTVVAVAGWFARTVTIAGAVVGAVIGIVMIAGMGWAGWCLLLLTFALAAASTRVGQARKQQAGIAEERGGRRGPGNAIANTGLAAGAAAISVGLHDPSLAWLVAVAALATAGSDTVASEIGKAFGRNTRLVTTGARVPPGTIGAVSLEGTVAGIAAAVALSGIGATLGLVPVGAVPVVTVAATLAALVEGGMGAKLETRGVLDNDTLNFVNTLVGAGLALAAWRWWYPS